MNDRGSTCKFRNAFTRSAHFEILPVNLFSENGKVWLIDMCIGEYSPVRDLVGKKNQVV